MVPAPELLPAVETPAAPRVAAGRRRGPVVHRRGDVRPGELASVCPGRLRVPRAVSLVRAGRYPDPFSLFAPGRGALRGRGGRPGRRRGFPTRRKLVSYTRHTLCRIEL